MKLQHIPLDQLKVSKLNMRYGRKAPDISDILPSVRERGVRQTLLVRKEGEYYGVVAGRRRFFALKQVAKETGKPITAPCGVLGPGDDAKAIEDSLLENIARLPADEFQQYDAFARLAAAGKCIEDIAETFGITELKVRRVLALANLIPAVKRLYEADEVDISTLRALTLASADQQNAWLALYHDEDEYAPRGDRLKAWLTGGANIKTEAALFDLTAYEGVILTDLFNDSAIFQDTELFWACQNTVIAHKVEDFRRKGWSDVVILERGHQFYAWDFAKRDMKQGGKVYVECRHDGRVSFHKGYLTKADAKKIDAILSGAPESNAPISAKPEMSGPLADYVRLHRHAMARAALLDRPGLALRLAVAHIIAGSDLWAVKAHQPGARKEATLESVAASSAHNRFLKEREVAGSLLKLGDDGEVLAGADFGRNLAAIFARLTTLDDESVMRLLAVAMADSLSDGCGVVEAIGHMTKIDVEGHWRPDDTFFDLLRDKRVINAMVAEIAGETVAASCLTDTGKTQKQIVLNRINGVGADPTPDWTPRWIQFPAASYLDGDDAEPAVHSRAVAHCFDECAQADAAT